MIFNKLRHFSYRIIAAAFLMLPGAQGFAQSLDQPVPTPPTGVASVEKYHSLYVHWNNITNQQITEFYLFRLENYSPDTTLKTVAVIPRDNSAIMQYRDDSALPNRTYTYFLTAKNAYGVQSANSKITTITTSAKLLHTP